MRMAPIPCAAKLPCVLSRPVAEGRKMHGAVLSMAAPHVSTAAARHDEWNPWCQWALTCATDAPQASRTAHTAREGGRGGAPECLWKAAAVGRRSVLYCICAARDKFSLDFCLLLVRISYLTKQAVPTDLSSI